MVRGELKSGYKVFVIRTEHYVTLATFTKHLTEHFINNNARFDIKLTKKQAEKILKRGLFFYGTEGETRDGFYEASFEGGERWNEVYNDAHEWVKSNYEWFINSPTDLL